MIGIELPFVELVVGLVELIGGLVLLIIGLNEDGLFVEVGAVSIISWKMESSYSFGSSTNGDMNTT